MRTSTDKEIDKKQIALLKFVQDGPCTHREDSGVSDGDHSPWVWTADIMVHGGGATFPGAQDDINRMASHEPPFVKHTRPQAMLLLTDFGRIAIMRSEGDKLSVPCSLCQGMGTHFYHSHHSGGQAFQRCLNCYGYGRMMLPEGERICPGCRGETWAATAGCQTCHGHGHIKQEPLSEDELAEVSGQIQQTQTEMDNRLEADETARLAGLLGDLRPADVPLIICSLRALYSELCGDIAKSEACMDGSPDDPETSELVRRWRKRRDDAEEMLFRLGAIE